MKIFDDQKSIKEPLQLNEAVNFNLRCIYIAIPKAGSTSVREEVASRGRFLVPGHHLNIVQIKEIMYTYFLLHYLGKNKFFPTGNVRSDAQIKEVSEQNFKGMFKFSVVRNPWVRAASLYARRDGIQVSNQIDFEQFILRHIYASDTCKWPTLHKNQYDWLCDEQGKMMMDFVFKIEESERGAKEIFEMTQGRINLNLPKLNSNSKSQALNYKNLFNQKTKNLIMKNFEKDIDYFKYSF